MKRIIGVLLFVIVLYAHTAALGAFDLQSFNKMLSMNGLDMDSVQLESLEIGKAYCAAVILSGETQTLAVFHLDADGNWQEKEINRVILNESKGMTWSLGMNEADDGTSLSVYGRLEEESESGGWINYYFECKDDDFMLEYFFFKDRACAEQAYPALQEMDMDQYSISLNRDDARCEVWLDVDAYHDGDWVGARGYEATESCRITLSEVRLSDLVERIRTAIEHRNDPPVIPDDGTPFALPQPQLASFAQEETYPVYTGPGEWYRREEEAEVSTNDWIQVFGEENGWLLIQHHVSGNLNRFGWIHATTEEAGVSVPALKWRNEGAIHRGWLTHDPLRTSAELDGTLPQNVVTVLATLGDWLYVQLEDDSGRLMRAFTSINDLEFP